MTTTNKKMTVMTQFLEVSSVKRAQNRSSETSAPLEGSAGFWRDTAIVLYEENGPSA